MERGSRSSALWRQGPELCAGAACGVPCACLWFPRGYLLCWGVAGDGACGAAAGSPPAGAKAAGARVLLQMVARRSGGRQSPAALRGAR